MKKNSLNKKILVAFACLLCLLVSVGMTVAYFSDYEDASGGATMHLQGRTELGEGSDHANKHIVIQNTGDMNMIVLIPNGQVTSGVDITFAANSAINLPITISANDDGTGESIHIYTDDGVISA